MFDSCYSTLGLTPGASPEDVRRAYRSLAKILHPDLNRSRNTTPEFQRLQEAYRILSQTAPGWPKRDRGRAPRSPGAREIERPALFKCACCRRHLAQPRFTTYWTVTSNLLIARQRPTAGLFCAPCGRKTAMRASLASALRGWWSIPGLLVTPHIIFRNAAGGDRRPGSDTYLLWQTAMIFYLRNDFRIARALAAKVADSKHPTAEPARFLLRRIARQQPDCPKVKLRNSWAANRADWWKHTALACSVPVAMLAAGQAYWDPIQTGMTQTGLIAQAYVDRQFPGARQRAETRFRGLVG